MNLNVLFSSILVILFLVTESSCKPKINQIINKKREGNWITTDTLDKIYTSKGKYRNGFEIGKWKYYKENNLVKKEVYRKNFCKTTFYHPNGKVMKKGYTKFESNSNDDRWFYFGNWKFYDTNGKLDSIKNYTKNDF
jgi:antitoxin component YwqK of YwqJK toxin-antitoxin module